MAFKGFAFGISIRLGDDLIGPGRQVIATQLGYWTLALRGNAIELEMLGVTIGLKFPLKPDVLRLRSQVIIKIKQLTSKTKTQSCDYFMKAGRWLLKRRRTFIQLMRLRSVLRTLGSYLTATIGLMAL